MPFLLPVGAALGGIVTNLLIGTALTIGATMISQALAPKPQAARDPGTSLTMQIGGDNPLSFFVGLGATAGHRVYAGTWGTDGETPNAFFVDVLELANVPLDGLNGVYVNGERATLHTGEVHAQYGIPISIGRKGGKDHLWVKFYDGRQTTPDAYLRSKFGGLAERPYGADMVGQGTPYAVVTTRYNRDLWKSGAPKMLFEVRGLRLYDIRKDSSAGGVGTHRRNNSATWEWTENPYVIAYNVAFMGVYVGTEWLWGLQNLPALRLPQSAWIAAMNESDRVLAAWGGQRQFTIGGEITVDMEPASFLDEVAKSSLGRFIESAGSYKPRCGAPGTSVYSFGEADLLITDPRTFTPFPGLENTHNTVEASYTEPAEAWGSKAAPVQSSATYIAADGNRRLSAGLTFPMVHRNEQVQRLSYSYLEDGRRFRQLQASFHPITWLLEPGDVIDGTILSEGYDGKTFEILSMSGRRTFVQTITLREIDPSDFDPPSSARQDWSVGPIQTIYPPAQPATGIAFEGMAVIDPEGRARRPGIIGYYRAGMDDVEYFEVRVRKPGVELPFFEARYDYPVDRIGEASQQIFSSAFLGGTDYEVQGHYRPFSGREVEWSSWLGVTTPEVQEVDVTDIRVAQLGKELQAAHGLVVGTDATDIPGRLAELQAYAQELALAVLDFNATTRETLNILSVHNEGTSAAVIRNEKAIVEEGRARAEALTEVLASLDDVIAGGFLKFEAEVNELASTANITAKVRATSGSDLSQAAWILKAEADGLGGTNAYFGSLGDFYVFTYVGGELTPIPVFSATADGVEFQDGIFAGTFQSKVKVNGVPLYYLGPDGWGFGA